MQRDSSSAAPSIGSQKSRSRSMAHSPTPEKVTRPTRRRFSALAGRARSRRSRRGRWAYRRGPREQTTAARRAADHRLRSGAGDRVRRHHPAAAPSQHLAADREGGRGRDARRRDLAFGRRRLHHPRRRGRRLACGRSGRSLSFSLRRRASGARPRIRALHRRLDARQRSLAAGRGGRGRLCRPGARSDVQVPRSRARALGASPGRPQGDAPGEGDLRPPDRGRPAQCAARP